MRGKFLDFIRLLRPQQWSKNGFVLAGYFFVQGWEQPGLTAQVALALVGFVLVSSAVYVLNDLADREVDRHHPRKCRRPIASGRVSTTAARLVLILLLAVGLLFSWQSSQT
ncbi:MAG: UbiA family prenyltransferase, partial [Acidobacteriota bacterium]